MLDQTVVLKADRTERIVADWGELTWFASGKLGNSDAVTVGRCVIRPGQSNPRHWHPNCAEILVVLEGSIMHAIEGGREVRLGVSDTISIPPRLPHYARNIGSKDAVLMIVFTTPDRQVENE